MLPSSVQADNYRELSRAVIAQAVSDFVLSRKPPKNLSTVNRLRLVKDQIECGRFLLGERRDPVTRLWFTQAELTQQGFRTRRMVARMAKLRTTAGELWAKLERERGRRSADATAKRRKRSPSARMRWATH